MKRDRAVKRRSGSARSGQSRRAPSAPNLRRSFIRAAAVLGVPVEDAERALILGQIAGLLIAHPRIGRALAFKGGAIMRLVDRSPRLSRDLDGSAVAGQRMQRRWIEEALSTPAARREGLLLVATKTPWPDVRRQLLRFKAAIPAQR